MPARIFTLFGEEILPEKLKVVPRVKGNGGEDVVSENDAAEVIDVLGDWKPSKQYYSIGEVSKLLSLTRSQIRYWTDEFSLAVRTTRKGDRLYTPEVIYKIRSIHHLLKQRGFTIAGAKAKLKSGAQNTVEALNLRHTLLQLRNQLLLIRNELL
jgi:DNA-binding transcriptional MerR regulator